MLVRTAVLCALAVIAGCASQSQSVPSTPDVAAAPAAVTASTEQASAPAVTPDKPPPGWKTRRRGGEILYCKTVNSTGSMFAQEVCLTPKELEAIRDVRVVVRDGDDVLLNMPLRRGEVDLPANRIHLHLVFSLPREWLPKAQLEFAEEKDNQPRRTFTVNLKSFIKEK